MNKNLSIDYSTLAILVQATQYFISGTLLIVTGNFVKDFLIKKWSFYNILLTLMCVLTILSSIVEAVAPNETLVVQWRSDVVPYNPTVRMINIFFNGVGYFEATSVYFWISFLRSWSLVQLRPEWERRGLSIAVILVISLQQVAMVLWIIEVTTMDTESLSNTASTIASLINFLIDSYYLSSFISFIRKSFKTLAPDNKDAKLLVISKYGIALVVPYLIAIPVNVSIPAGRFRDFVISQVVLLSSWYFCVVLIAMSYKLRSIANARNFDTTKVPEVTRSENVTTIATRRINAIK